MENVRVRTYRLDGDALEIVSRYDESSRLWIEDYVNFEDEPRYTPQGRPWKSVITTDCPYADPVFRDCGTCPWLIKEKPTDLIGVCDHREMRRREPIPSTEESA